MIPSPCRLRGKPRKRMRNPLRLLIIMNAQSRKKSLGRWETA